MSEKNQRRSDESLRHEYTEVVQSIRHYSNLRFAIFTIFFAVMGGVGFVGFGQEQFSAQAALVARIAGFAVAVVFWLYQERTARMWEHCRLLAVSLERELDYKQFSTRPDFRGIPTAIVLNRFVFVLFSLLWAYAVLAVPLDR